MSDLISERNTSPINRLSPEILSETFMQSRFNHCFRHAARAYGVPLIWMGVCKRWRDVALITPQLWGFNISRSYVKNKETFTLDAIMVACTRQIVSSLADGIIKGIKSSDFWCNQWQLWFIGAIPAKYGNCCLLFVNNLSHNLSDLQKDRERWQNMGSYNRF